MIYSIATVKTTNWTPRSWEIPGKVPRTHKLNYLLYYQLINMHHITSKTLTEIKISHAVSLQVASLARSTLSAMIAGDPSQTTLVQITHVFFMLCCCTQIGCVEQHKNEENVCNLH